MKNTIRGWISVLMLCATFALAESETLQRENNNAIRVAISSSPGIDESKFASDTDAASLKEDSGTQVELLVTKRFWNQSTSEIGSVFEIGFFMADHNGTDKGNDKYSLDASGVVIQGGIAMCLYERMVLEVTPFVGFGRADIEIVDLGNGSAPYVMHGITGRVFLLINETVEVGLKIQHSSFESELEVITGGGPDDLTLSGEGVSIGAVFSISF